jgi:hypothetical protein
MSYYSDEQLWAFRLIFWGAFIAAGVIGAYMAPHSVLIPILCPVWLAAWARLHVLKKRRAEIHRRVAELRAEDG